MIIQTSKIFNGTDFQSIKIPNQLKIDDDKVYIKKVGNALYIIPFHNPWQTMLDSLNKFTPDFMENREQPKKQQRENL